MPVNGLLSPDDSILITVNINKTARAWSLANGEQLGETLELSGHPKMASIRPDGRALVIATQDAFNHKEEIYLRDLGPGDWKDPLAGLDKDGPGSRRFKDKGYFFAALAADGKTLAVADPRKCALLDWRDLSVRAAFPPHGIEIHFLTVSPDGNTVAVAGKQDPHVHLFDARTEKERHKFEGHRDGVRALAYSPDGKPLAATLANNRIAIWDPEAGKVAACLPRASGADTLRAVLCGDSNHLEWRAMIRVVTQSLYVLLGVIFLLGGSGVLLLGTGLMPAPVRDVVLSIGEDNPHTLHLMQEYATLLVLVALLTFWFVKHYELSRPFHWAMTLFWGLIALVHWFDPRGEFHYGLAEAITSVPFVVFVALGLLRGRNNGHVDRSG